MGMFIITSESEAGMAKKMKFLKNFNIYRRFYYNRGKSSYSK